METSDRIATLRVVGGNLALDFVNTVDGDPAFDHLRDYGGLVAWGGHVGLIPEEAVRRLIREAEGSPSEAGTIHEHALALRETLSGIFAAIARGERPPERGLEALRGKECEALARARLKPKDGGYSWEWPDGGVESVLWHVVHAAVELLTSGPLDRVKTCAGCHWIFVDESKNRSRRWCTMEICGTNEKMRRYVARRAARRG